LNEFTRSADSLYIAYVLAPPIGHPDGYGGDIFIFPVRRFDELINAAIVSKSRAKMVLARSRADGRWYLLKTLALDEISSETTVDVTEYRRNFHQLSIY
jgi:hypothetical protein